MCGSVERVWGARGSRRLCDAVDRARRPSESAAVARSSRFTRDSCLRLSTFFGTTVARHWFMAFAAVVMWLPGLVGCAAPISCPPRHFAREEEMCPACEHGRDCPCTRGWVCRETRELAEERRQRARDEALARAAAERVDVATMQATPTTSAIAPPPPPEPERTHRLLPTESAALCAQACPQGGIRRVSARCVEENHPRAQLMSRCPELLGSEARCAVPWEVTSVCDPPAPPPPPRPRCRARRGTCCMPDGTVVVPCGPGPGRPGCQGGACGSGGFCRGCR